MRPMSFESSTPHPTCPGEVHEGGRVVGLLNLGLGFRGLKFRSLGFKV